jgi:hypothetical protein
LSTLNASIRVFAEVPPNTAHAQTIGGHDAVRTGRCLASGSTSAAQSGNLGISNVAFGTLGRAAMSVTAFMSVNGSIDAAFLDAAMSLFA